MDSYSCDRALAHPLAGGEPVAASRSGARQAEWMDLKTAQSYTCVSERTLREWIHRPINPLPAVQVDRGKILIKRSTLDRWLESHPVQVNENDLARLVDDVVCEVMRPN